MINLACHSCGSTFSVPDSFAGRSGKCKQCGLGLTVPAAPDPPFVIVQDDQPVRLTSGPRQRRKPTGAASYLGAVAAIPVVASLFVVLLLSQKDPEGAQQFLQLSGGLAMILVPFSPIVVLPLLSRAGVLSMGRWLIMAGFCAAVAVLCCCVSLGVQSTADHTGKVHPMLAMVMTVAAFGGFLALAGIPGSLLAAAIYPKGRA